MVLQGLLPVELPHRSIVDCIAAGVATLYYALERQAQS